jgi:hypothetical protein
VEEKMKEVLSIRNGCMLINVVVAIALVFLEHNWPMLLMIPGFCLILYILTYIRIPKKAVTSQVARNIYRVNSSFKKNTWQQAVRDVAKKFLYINTALVSVIGIVVLFKNIF